MIAVNKLSVSRAILLVCLLSCFCSVSLGGISFQSNSTATWTFDPDTAGGSQLKVVNVNPPPASSSMSSFQINQSFTQGSASSTATGAIGYVVNSTTATFTLKAGTGVTQSDPGNAQYTGDSLLRVDFTGYFKATSPSFGPVATGYVSVAVGGTVGAGGNAKFIGQVNFRDANTNTLLRPTVNFNQTFSTAGPFAQTFTSSSLLNPTSYATNSLIKVQGFFEFRAANCGRPSQIVPLDIEFGGAPPTATWYLNANGNWNDPRSWTAPQGSFIEDLGAPQPPFPDDQYGDGEIFGDVLKTQFPLSQQNPPDYGGDYSLRSIPEIPNGVGQRARFASFARRHRIVTLDADVVLGALDIDTAGFLTFKSRNRSAFYFDTESGNASITARNVRGGAGAKFDAPLVLRDTLELLSDGDYVPGGKFSESTALMLFNSPITGDGGIEKYGQGEVSLNVRNNYVGGTLIAGGKLNANAPGSLGQGWVLADNGQLNYNAHHAAQAGVAVQARNGGQIDLGVVPRSSEQFIIEELAAISGNAAELGALTIQPPVPLHIGWPAPNGGANLQLRSGAMIAHESWDTGIRGNPRNLGNLPQYIFGIAADFMGKSRSITIGSESGSPWSGFGSDRTERTFGSNPWTRNEKLYVKGTADLVSLNQTLFLNAKIISEGQNAQLNKKGAGAVAINNMSNEFFGGIDVQSGQLLVNGNLRGVTGVVVQPGATLGGLGTIGGPVTVHEGGQINPGGNRPGELVGTLTTGPLSLLGGNSLRFDFLDPDHYDRLVVLGDLDMQSLNYFDIHDLGNFGPGSYRLIEYTGSLIDPDPDLFVGFSPDGWQMFNYQIEVVSNAIVLNVSAWNTVVSLPDHVTAVPEPSLAGVLLGTAGLMIRRRRPGRCIKA